MMKVETGRKKDSVSRSDPGVPNTVKLNLGLRLCLLLPSHQQLIYSIGPAIAVPSPSSPLPSSDAVVASQQSGAIFIFIPFLLCCILYTRKENQFCFYLLLFNVHLYLHFQSILTHNVKVEDQRLANLVVGSTMIVAKHNFSD